MTDRQIMQLLVDALISILVGGQESLLQAEEKVDQAQAALLEDEAGVSE